MYADTEHRSYVTDSGHVRGHRAHKKDHTSLTVDMYADIEHRSYVTDSGHVRGHREQIIRH